MARNTDNIEPNEAVEPAEATEPAAVADPHEPDPVATIENTEGQDVIAEPLNPAPLVHSDPDAPMSTKQDATDVGVPMLPGSPNEPQGPEDALGPGPKRGDYTGRIGSAAYQPHESIRGEDGKVVVVPQRPRAEDIGDEAGVKGGVNTVENL